MEAGHGRLPSDRGPLTGVSPWHTTVVGRRGRSSICLLRSNSATMQCGRQPDSGDERWRSRPGRLHRRSRTRLGGTTDSSYWDATSCERSVPLALDSARSEQGPMSGPNVAAGPPGAPPRASICGRGSVWRRVEQGQLGSIGRLEHASPPVQVCTANRVTVPGRFRVPCLDAPPEFVGRYIEVVQLDVDTKTTSCGSHLVTFDPPPQPEIEDAAQAEAQDLLGEAPEFMFDLLPGPLVPRCGAEGPEPFILREAHGASLSG